MDLLSSYSRADRDFMLAQSAKYSTVSEGIYLLTLLLRATIAVKTVHRDAKSHGYESLTAWMYETIRLIF